MELQSGLRAALRRDSRNSRGNSKQHYFKRPPSLWHGNMQPMSEHLSYREG